MESLFEFKDIDPDDIQLQKYPSLKINKSPSFYLILRGITGNLNITQNFSNTCFNQDQNFLDGKLRYVSFKSNEDVDGEKEKPDRELIFGINSIIEFLKIKNKSNLELIPRYISDSFTLEDLSKILLDREIINRNKNFFAYLNDEFCNFYYYTSKDNHTVAFLHIYRILEYISYTFPIMYATKTKDFSGSFDALKILFQGDKDKGELKVFKDFIQIILNSENNYETLSIDIHITSDSENYNSRIYKTLLDICDESIFYTDRNVENSKLVIKFTEFSSFIITVRNRFFHLKNSHSKNIHSIDIIDADFFFSLINKKCMYFLCLITIEVIKKSYFTKTSI